ncbi:MAG: dienelactone hydrolase [Acidimicrobiales bacterium]|nr:dienelactone hydrolase [Acidimicrobiales bacterium]MCB1014209.1 dienelactone hydrolase [Acidimicrobiales bacterium]MCB9372744.1 dienelactone hydrolase [Microthrixaceae bacterium]
MTSVTGVFLTPGAGSGRDQSTLVALEGGLAPLPVARVDFPYRREGRKAPDRAPKLVAFLKDEATVVAEQLGVEASGLVFGGRSMGGRMCSMAVAEGMPAAGLVLISYPLHPPGKPEKLRTEHLPQLDLPCLFVSGTRDPFATPDELTEALALIPGPVTTVWLDGGRHDLKGRDDEVVAAVGEWLAGL